jgi:predicted PurR-regulated permease PerM
MSSSDPSSVDLQLQRTVETTVRLGLIFLLIALCFLILAPFAVPVLWGIIIAVATGPVHDRVTAALGGRQRLAAALLTLLGLVAIIVPAVIFAGSILGGAGAAAGHLSEQSPLVPPPPDAIRGWPFVGEPLFATWGQASRDLAGTLERFRPQLRAAGTWLLETGAGTGWAFVQFLISIAIGGVLLGASGEGRRVAGELVTRLAGHRGLGYLDLATATIRSVCTGVLGVAVIQSALISIGFLVVGVPHAGVWAALCLFLAVLQLTPLLVVAPVVVYVFHTEPTWIAVLFLIWQTVAGLSDNVLKPILLSRGVQLPMIVIFLGSIGGFIAFGFIGLFVGAVVLSLGFTLLRAWMQPVGEAEPEAAGG